jgi:hypothetical protein
MKTWHKILIVLAIGGAAYALYAIYKAFIAGEKTISGLLMAPFTYASQAYDAVTGAASTVAGNAAAAASLPGLASQSASLDSTIISQGLADYAPGGRIYNQVAATSGTAAADANYAKVQGDYAAMQQQTSSWWNPLTW